MLAQTATAAGSEEARLIEYEVARKYTHETVCFTEGLFLNDTGTEPEVFESCGLYGRSYLRRYKLGSGETVQKASVPSEIFSEGLALVGKSLYMLTYHAKQVLEYDSLTLKEVRRHPFPYGEGWGLTTDGCDLLATTGSSFIFRLRADAAGTLQLVHKVEVKHRGKPVRMLNEMEFITPKLWVNQWHTNIVWRVDPLTGECEAKLDVGKLHSWRGEQTPNGLAYSVLLGSESLLVTGKQWPSMFLLRLAPTDLCGLDTTGAALPAAPACARAPPSACWTPPQSAGAVVVAPAPVPATTAAPVTATVAGSTSAAAGAPAQAPEPETASAMRGYAPATGLSTAEAPVHFEPAPPLPWAFTVVATAGGVALGIAAFVVPFRLRAPRAAVVVKAAPL